MKTSITKANKPFLKLMHSALVFLFWVSVWQLCYLLIGRDILVVSPLSVFQNIWTLGQKASFWLSVYHSLTSVLLGFCSALLAGTLLALATHFSPLLHRLFEPAIHVIKATPVASFILLALFFLHSAELPAFISFLMVLPLVWANLSEGLRATDPKLLEMARVFRLPLRKRLRHIYFPAIAPAFLASFQTGLGFSWKAGIAAEVLATPDNTLGKNLFEAKIFLDTLGVFSWTIVVIIISILLEKILLWVMGKIWRPAVHRKGTAL